MFSKRTKYTPAVHEQNEMVDLIDLKRELEPFLEAFEEAIEEAKKGKITKLKKFAVTMETVRIVREYVHSLEKNDIKGQEYYGKLIRDHMMDRPKTSLGVSAEGDTGIGVVILPAVEKGEK